VCSKDTIDRRQIAASLTTSHRNQYLERKFTVAADHQYHITAANDDHHTNEE